MSAKSELAGQTVVVIGGSSHRARHGPARPPRGSRRDPQIEDLKCLRAAIARSGGRRHAKRMTLDARRKKGVSCLLCAVLMG
jgi:hypothetical protein